MKNSIRHVSSPRLRTTDSPQPIPRQVASCLTQHMQMSLVSHEVKRRLENSTTFGLQLSGRRLTAPSPMYAWTLVLACKAFPFDGLGNSAEIAVLA